MTAEINQIIDTVKFRIEEEARVEREQEEFYLNVMKTKDEAQADVTVHVMAAVFDELSLQCRRLLDDPLEILLWSRTFFLIVCLLVVLYETAAAVKTILLRKRASVASHHKQQGQSRHKPSDVVNNAALLKSMVLPESVREQLLNVAVKIAAASFFHTNFPNAIVTGCTGAGKSLAAKAVAEAAGLEYEIISAGMSNMGGKVNVFAFEYLFVRGGGYPVVKVTCHQKISKLDIKR